MASVRSGLRFVRLRALKQRIAIIETVQQRVVAIIQPAFTASFHIGLLRYPDATFQVVPTRVIVKRFK